MPTARHRSRVLPMPEPSRRICLEIDPDEQPLQGRVTEAGASTREFAGWLGLLTVLGHLLDDPTPVAESSAPPIDPQ